jgi:hypothetical protein
MVVKPLRIDPGDIHLKLLVEKHVEYDWSKDTMAKNVPFENLESPGKVLLVLWYRLCLYNGLPKIVNICNCNA